MLISNRGHSSEGRLLYNWRLLLHKSGYVNVCDIILYTPTLDREHTTKCEKIKQRVSMFFFVGQTT